MLPSSPLLISPCYLVPIGGSFSEIIFFPTFYCYDMLSPLILGTESMLCFTSPQLRRNTFWRRKHNVYQTSIVKPSLRGLQLDWLRFIVYLLRCGLALRVKHWHDQRQYYPPPPHLVQLTWETLPPSHTTLCVGFKALNLPHSLISFIVDTVLTFKAFTERCCQHAIVAGQPCSWVAGGGDRLPNPPPCCRDPGRVYRKALWEV